MFLPVGFLFSIFFEGGFFGGGWFFVGGWIKSGVLKKLILFTVCVCVFPHLLTKPRGGAFFLLGIWGSG